MLDVAVAAELLFDTLLGPGCRGELAKAFAPLGEHVKWVALLCGLHDLGKLSPAFQAVRHDVALRDLAGSAAVVDVQFVHENKPDRGRTDTYHGLLTAMHLRRLLCRWGAPQAVQQDIALAVGGHHGLFDTAKAIEDASHRRGHHGGERWQAWVDGAVVRVAELLGLPDPATRPWSKIEFGWPTRVGLAGLATVSDWIGTRAVPVDKWAGPQVDLDSYPKLARERVNTMIEELQLARWHPPADTSFESLFREVARPWQQTVEKALQTQTVPGVLIIETPTGEGKTWSAIQAAAKFVSTHSLAGLYYGTPTRATGNQAYRDISGHFDRLGGGPPVILLRGAAAEYLALDRTSSRSTWAENFPGEGFGQDEPGASHDQQVREWFTRSKGLLASLPVGTVDRALQAGIRARFVAAALVGLSNKVIVIDEVHAYDTYMSTLLDRLLWWLGTFQTPVVLLSATLPFHRRNGLLAHWCAGARGVHPDEIDFSSTKVTYPSIIWADAHGHKPIPVKVSAHNRNRTVVLTRLTDGELVPWLLNQAAQGRCIAAVHNLLRRVEATETALRQQIATLPPEQQPELIVLTGELKNEARAAVENRLSKLVGPQGNRPHGLIVVASSALENSLDLDFDAMARDLGPIDSMIQLLGRLYRFRQASKPPTLAITGVTDSVAGPLFPPHTKRVHHEMILLRTWALLCHRTHLYLPDEAADLVNAVYGKEPMPSPEGWRVRWQRAEVSLQQVLENERRDAEWRYLPQPTPAHGLRSLTVDRMSTKQTRSTTGRGRRE